MARKGKGILNIRKFFKKEKEEGDIVDELTKSYLKRKESGEEHPIDATIAQIMDIIKNSQNPDETAQKIITAAIDANTMPNRIPEKLSIIISKDEELNDEIITKAVEESSSDVPSEMIDTIIEQGSLDAKERLKLIKNADDEVIIRKRILNEFDELYKKCKDLKDHDVVDRICQLVQIVHENNIEIDLKNIIIEIVSKKMAENYYCDEIKGTTLYRLSKSISLVVMYEINIAKKVEEEFFKLEKQRGKKEDGRFKRDELDNRILKEIAKETGYKYRTTGRFLIPESKRLHNISNQLENEFIDEIATSSNKKKLTDEDIQTIRNQLRGAKKLEEEKEYNLIKSITQMEDKGEYLDLFLKITNNEEERKTLKSISEAGIIESLSLLDEEKRKIAICKIADVIEKKVISKTKVEDINKDDEDIDR